MEERAVDKYFPEGKPDSALFVPIGHALLGHLVKYDKLWIMMGEFAISIFQSFGKYYVFDSHSRQVNGMFHQFGRAAMCSFQG